MAGITDETYFILIYSIHGYTAQITRGISQPIVYNFIVIRELFLTLNLKLQQCSDYLHAFALINLHISELILFKTVKYEYIAINNYSSKFSS